MKTVLYYLLDDYDKSGDTFETIAKFQNDFYDNKLPEDIAMAYDDFSKTETINLLYVFSKAVVGIDQLNKRQRGKKKILQKWIEED